MSRAWKKLQQKKNRDKRGKDTQNRDLKRLIEQKSKELLEKQEVLIQSSKMAALGEMIGSIAHQWKQPINTISLIVDKIDDLIDDYKIEGKLKKELLEVEKGVQKQIDFMVETMNEFRDFFRPSKLDEELNVEEMIDDVIELVDVQFKEEEIDIRFDKRCECKSRGSVNEFKQVILNILSNSKDVFLQREIKDRYITISTTKDRMSCIIEIEDSGGGIDERLLPLKLFKNYVTTKGENGTGLGLYISEMIIKENLKGNISAKNSNNGSIFTIQIPQSGQLIS